jgi:hypothetical protein
MKDKNKDMSKVITNTHKPKNSDVPQSDNLDLVNDLERSLETTLNDSIKIIQNMLESIETNVNDKNLKNDTLLIMNKLLLNLKNSTEKTQKNVINFLEDENALEEK